MWNTNKSDELMGRGAGQKDVEEEKLYYSYIE